MNISFNNREYGILAAALINRKDRILELKKIFENKGDQEMIDTYQKELEALINLEERLYQEFIKV